LRGFCRQTAKKYSLRSESTANLTDLRGGPTDFVGAFDNTWTLRLVKPLRYLFANDPAMTRLGIVDANAPTSTRWFVDRTQQMATNNYRDYAIGARFTDPTTGKLTVISAGVGVEARLPAENFSPPPQTSLS
jgi:hypothetical protein